MLTYTEEKIITHEKLVKDFKDPAAVLCDNPNCPDCTMQRGLIKKHRLKKESFILSANWTEVNDGNSRETVQLVMDEGMEYMEMDFGLMSGQKYSIILIYARKQILYISMMPLAMEITIFLTRGIPVLNQGYRFSVVLTLKAFWCFAIITGSIKPYLPPTKSIRSRRLLLLSGKCWIICNPKL